MDRIHELSEEQSPGTGRAEDAAFFPKTAALLMDVKLQVRVLFGRTQIRLKDLLKLGSGSIVELDRAGRRGRAAGKQSRDCPRPGSGRRVLWDPDHGDSEARRVGGKSTAADLVSLFQNVD